MPGPMTPVAHPGRLRAPILLAALLLPATAQAQTITFEEYEPRSTLVVPEHLVTRAKYPFVDVHNHQSVSISEADAARLVQEMDKLNMAVMVNLSGRTGGTLRQAVGNLQGRHPKRFLLFANLSFEGLDEPGYAERLAAQLERDVRENGAQGLKIFKNLGLDLKDSSGKRVRVDDPRFDPVWRKAGELGIPVLIHTGEPASFFEAHDRFNERWLELKQYPNRARPADRYPAWEEVMAEQHAVFRKHPNTRFINAHLGWMGGDLARLGKLMDELPNMYTEIGAVLAELGRQPRAAREFMTRHQDRVLFGKDAWAPEEYHVYFRVLETADEYFPYYRKRHAFWRMYGLDLPDEVLRKLYYQNALRLFPGIDRSLFPS